MSDLALQLIRENIKKHQRGADATYLDLGRCGLTHLPPELGECVWVETLILSTELEEYDLKKKQWEIQISQNRGEPNRIASIKGVEKLRHLKKLVMAKSDFDSGENWELNDLSPLAALSQLQTLICSSTQVSDLSPLAALSQLQTLTCYYTEVSDLLPLAALYQLQRLHCSATYVSDLSPLVGLSQLQVLDCYSTEVSDLSPLAALSQLQVLDCSATEVSDLSPLSALSQLQMLYCYSTEVSDLSPLSALSQLQRLNCSRTQVSDLSPLSALSQLQTLNCSRTEVSDLSPLAALSQLQTLDCNFTQVSDLSPLATLSQLQTLDCNFTQVSDLSPLTGLSQLQTLNCFDTRVSDLSPLLPLIKKGVPVKWAKYESSGIIVGDCPLTNPPRKIVEQGNTAILEYFKQKEKEGKQLLLEAKLVLLGDGRAGKTSLACRLLGKELPTEADRTQGVVINIGDYQFPVAEGVFKLHIWDFAGQDKYKPLHQFFYTEGAVYVMVADSGNAGTDFNDWFQAAELFGKDDKGQNSPLIVALNEFRDGIGRGTFDEERWRKQFPTMIKEVRLVNLLSEKGWPTLEKDIQHFAETLPHTKVSYPKNWAVIRSVLERHREENYISQQEYFKICRENNLPERESALILSRILHTIGVCLHYQSNELLRQHVILKNEWATKAVYQILEDTVVANDKKGFFNQKDLERIWRDETYADMRPQLLELMQQFKMAYPLPNRKEYVTPPLLPAAPPSGWDLPESPDTVELFVEYKFLPKSLMTQFIVSRHTDIDNGRTLVWRNGAVLRWSADTVSEIKVYKSRGRDAFYIRTQGHDRRYLLTAMLKTLRELHAEYPGIGAYEIVPCPCSVCREQQNETEKHYFDFANLQNRLEKGRRTVECDKSLEEIDLMGLMGGMFVFEKLEVGQRVELKEQTTPPGIPAPSARVPVVFTAFANPKGDLHGLSEEQRGIQDALRSIQAKGAINCIFRTDTDRTDYFDYLLSWENQISLFHYAGHANHKGLSLQDIHADFKPLADELLLRNKESLCVVVLNGCSTQAHVKGLLEKGVKAVIATSSSVGDTLATEFAIRFYTNLANGDTLQVAYESAANFAKTGNGEKRFQHWGKILRDTGFDDTNPADEFPWGLYISDDERVLQYTLCGGMPGE